MHVLRVFAWLLRVFAWFLRGLVVTMQTPGMVNLPVLLVSLAASSARASKTFAISDLLPSQAVAKASAMAPFGMDFTLFIAFMPFIAFIAFFAMVGKWISFAIEASGLLIGLCTAVALVPFDMACDWLED